MLVCEDDPLVRQTMAELLETMDCDVRQAERGTAARAVARRPRHHLLITDLGLPDESGLDLACWARSQQPDLSIAIASGNGSAQAVAQLPGAMALPKPFDLDDLAALIRQVRERLGSARRRRFRSPASRCPGACCPAPQPEASRW